MDRNFDEGDMVIIRNRKSKFYQHSGKIETIDYDDDLERDIYKIKFDADEVANFYVQDLDMDAVERETTELM